MSQPLSNVHAWWMRHNNNAVARPTLPPIKKQPETLISRVVS
ncbi:hypothetical protein [Kingella sp. (in: b-proteobacteria)]|nr:hypothetical protein [Kingella sp. (in: b-proteobacteria)]MDO4656599.1 hypothetical protein [Kingella sp. (in: b-proteobacteria)]